MLKFYLGMKCSFDRKSIYVVQCLECWTRAWMLQSESPLCQGSSLGDLTEKVTFHRDTHLWATDFGLWAMVRSG